MTDKERTDKLLIILIQILNCKFEKCNCSRSDCMFCEAIKVISEVT